MAIEAASNAWTDVESATVAALPQLAAFQSFVGVASAAAAADYAFLEELGEAPAGRTWSPEELAEIAHYGIVTSPPELPYQADRITPDGFSFSGRVLLYFDRRIAASDLDTQDEPRANRNQVDRTMKNRVGSILEELVALWDDEGGVYVMRYSIVEGPMHNHPNERAAVGHWQGCLAAFDWGPRVR